MLFLLKLHILSKLYLGEEHTINSLSKALAPHYCRIYQTPAPPCNINFKNHPIPKIDIKKALDELEALNLIEKQEIKLNLSFRLQTWTEEATIYKITPKGRETFNRIMQKYDEIESLLEPTDNHPQTKEPYII